MNKISVVFPTFDDPIEAVETAKSIRATAGNAVEICVVDDGEDPPLFTPELNVVYHKNKHRIGSGPSRHLGATIASGSYIVQCDSHVRFSPGWLDVVSEKAFANPKTVYCAQMLALETGCMDMANHRGSYNGATWTLNGTENGRPKILECVWADVKPGDEYELSGLMGSTYSFNREFYLSLSPHRFLRSFGLEEESLSLKTWLSGGEIRMLKLFVIGHKFRTCKERVPYVIRVEDIIQNKIFIALTCLPEDKASYLISKMSSMTGFQQAMTLIRRDWHLIETEQENNRKIFTRDFNWLVTRFGLQC